MKHHQNARSWSRIKGFLPIFVSLLLSLSGFFHTLPVQAETGTACPSGSTCVFIPAVVSGVPTSFSNDLVLQGVEVTQAVQDAQNSVPLIAGRPTVLRIYATAAGFLEPVSNVKVSVTATQSGKQAEGSPDTFTTRIPLTNSRADYSSTINFPLPEKWITGSYDLTIRIDPDNAVAEVSKVNNTLNVHLDFNKVPDLKLMIVPVQYTHSSNGHTYPAPTVDNISAWLMSIYPVSKVEVTWHTPYAFSGDLRTAADFNRLLNEVTTLKTSEKASSEQVYYGLVPTQDGAQTWFYGGIAGIGWVGGRASVGIDLPGNTAQVAGHEIGHNLGMLHTPCGVNGDPNYPYAGGSIGQFGFDVFTNTIYDPSSSKDMMSYCNPRWVSDYTYKFLYASQMATAATVTPQRAASAGSSRGLLVRATITSNQAVFEPSYVLEGQVSNLLEKGDYTIQMVNTQGEVISQSAVKAYAVEDEDGAGGASTYGINTIVPLPDQPVAAVRLMKGDTLLAEQKIQAVTKDQPMAVSTEKSASGLTVRWGWSDRAAMLRFSADGGKTWSTLATDVKTGQMNLSTASLPTSGGVFEVVPANIWR